MEDSRLAVGGLLGAHRDLPSAATHGLPHGARRDPGLARGHGRERGSRASDRGGCGSRVAGSRKGSLLVMWLLGQK